MDLRNCAVPLAAESAIALSVHPYSTSFVSVHDALETMGGQAASKILARETRILDVSASVCSVNTTTTERRLPGYFGGSFRLFRPKSIAIALEQIGGVAVVLQLICLATTSEYLRTAVRLLVLVIKHSPRNAREMERFNGYAILSMLLEKKHSLLDHNVLGDIISLTWADPKSVTMMRSPSPQKTKTITRDQPSITNAMAFREFLLNYDVWHSTPEGLTRLIFTHVRRLAAAGPMQAKNIEILLELRVIDEYMAILRKDGTPAVVAHEISSILCEIYAVAMTPKRYDPSFDRISCCIRWLLIQIAYNIGDVVNTDKVVRSNGALMGHPSLRLLQVTAAVSIFAEHDVGGSCNGANKRVRAYFLLLCGGFSLK